MKIIKTVSTLIQYFQKHKGWVLERIFLLTLAIDWIYRIDLNCVDSKKTGTELDQYRVRRARARWKRFEEGRRCRSAVEIKALPPLPLSLLPQVTQGLSGQGPVVDCWAARQL